MDSNVELMKKKHSNGELFNINEYTEHATTEMVFIGSFDIDIRQHEEGDQIEHSIFDIINM